MILHTRELSLPREIRSLAAMTEAGARHAEEGPDHCCSLFNARVTQGGFFMRGNGPSFGLKKFAEPRRSVAFRLRLTCIAGAIVFCATFAAPSPAQTAASGQAMAADLAGSDTCAPCHGEVVKSMAANPHAKAGHTGGTGAVTCESCHDAGKAHAESGDPGKIKGLKSAAQQNAACTSCHREKAGPFVYEHDVVKTEGCTACHFAHGGANPRMLNRAAVNTICQQCHSPSLASSAAHNQANQPLPCTSCHREIHGSNTHPNFFKTTSEDMSRRGQTFQSLMHVLTIGADVCRGAVRPLSNLEFGNDLQSGSR